MTLITLMYADHRIAKIAEIAKECKIENHRQQISFSAIFGTLGISGNCLIAQIPR